ncbi:hypothetical protein [Glycomyces sp. YM15]|uniref:hypothetical protein n=1 Tax=Glycomyces sp. YM15 TaxID=2800446 RepID=UPI0019669252|nr:hypothetical protein [Glycomyces sp. YM15]
MTDLNNVTTVTFTGLDRDMVSAAAAAAGLDFETWVTRQARREALAAATREWADRPVDPDMQAWFAATTASTTELWQRTAERTDAPHGWEERESPQR